MMRNAPVTKENPLMTRPQRRRQEKRRDLAARNPTSPKRNAELVMRYTSQFIAVCSIHEKIRYYGTKK